MPLTMDINEDSFILTAELPGWANILVTLVVWDAPSLGVKVNFSQYSLGIDIADNPVDLWLGSEIGYPLGYLLDYEIWTPVVLQLIVDIPPGSKVRYPDLVGSPSQYTIDVPPSWSCPIFPPPTYGRALLIICEIHLLRPSLGRDPLSLGGAGTLGTSASPKVTTKQKMN